VTEPRITPQARADLEEAWDYIAQHNVAAADRLIDGIFTQATYMLNCL
jgi:plasmid stabilization system protein ParE